MESTPTKTSKIQDLSSPSAKRALDFDFWSDRKRKVPKIVEDDVQYLKIRDLSVTKRFIGKLLLRCSGIFDGSKVFKLACDDEESKITITAFGTAAEKFRGIYGVNDIFEISNFEVTKENLAHLTGTFQDFQIISGDSTTVKVASGSFQSLPYDLKTVVEIKECPDLSVIDTLVVIAKNWGKTTTSTGKEKGDVSLTDKSMETIRLTLWEKDADQLVGIETQVIAISRGVVSTFQGVKVLTSKWHTHITVNPENSDAEELLTWFKNEIQQDS